MVSDPMKLFEEWFAEAQAGEPFLAEAMTLATADSDGNPSARMVLLKSFGEGGFTFYTNLDSRKALELAANPRAALLFYWKSLRRQVRIEGPAEPVAEEAADEYFATRPRDSQIGAWASDQSRPLDSYETLERHYEEMRGRFGDGPVARPARWSGYSVRPQLMEFWSERPHRLHERRLFRVENGRWTEGLLYP